MPKVRFAPSPTGFLHIGGARTALFNWMYAKAVGGQFVLRIEDTDLERSKQEYVDEIMDSMRWLGMDWDELYTQSDRFDLYREHAKRLLDEGKAYEKDGAILLKMPKTIVKIYDLIRDEIEFDTSNFIVRDDDKQPILDKNGEPQLKDEVLIKADGSPAYSFCCVIDDALMEITHVIRGEDHISNTPKQLVIYEALGFKPPKYAHLPLILGEDGQRLSKRHGAVAVTDYKKQGFLSKAMMNYLMLLGWAPSANQEVIEMDAAIKKFSIKKVNKAAAAFSMDKLKWINSEYIKQLDGKSLWEALVSFVKENDMNVDVLNEEQAVELSKLYQPRIPTLIDFVNWADFAFIDQVNFDEGVEEQHLIEEKIKYFPALIERLKKLDVFNADTAESSFKEVLEENGLKTKDLIHPVRVALTGKGIGPSLFHIMEILGLEKTVQRLEIFVKA